ncbi:MAG: type II secretion system protein GspG [Candidatus Omnitrophica bacterium]|nr:type II secretion system protein GspG [Candidatus Omnitrophota bacterium]MCM8802084.1 type II secretion system protein GspG [Candidatus Omnitrophota bacterium]
MKKGYILIEVVVGILIFLILTSGIFFGVKNIIDRAKVMSAKAQISQLALLLEQVKNDTSFYPAFLSDLTSNSPPRLQEKGWDGPYTKKIPLDPWGNPYFYYIPPTTVFSSPKLPRVYGKPDEYRANFQAIEGKGRIRVENYGVTSCSIYINGVEVVKENEFRNNPRPQIIEKEINLLDANNTVTWARSTPGDFLYFSIVVENMPTGEYFILGSYGKDGKQGGKLYNKDIVWVSNKYPNFQE